MARRRVRWLPVPEEKDYGAAESFLSLLVPAGELQTLAAGLRSAPMGTWKAKDILRAAGLPALRPKRSAEVADKLLKVRAGEPISPVLLVAGLREPVVIADGYHRVSAAIRIHEDVLVPGRLLWLG